MTIIEQQGRVEQLTFGTEEGRFHSHSYYDIPVVSPDGSEIVVYETTFKERMPVTADKVLIKSVNVDSKAVTGLGDSSAWSWQQGPLAQFVPGTSSIVWNDRDGERFVTRMWTEGEVQTLPRPTYALHPDGGFGLSLDMGRLEALRPGYGYAVETRPNLVLRPSDDGVWRLDLETGASALILSVSQAVRFVLARLSVVERFRLRATGYAFWFNHAKFSPDGRRFTVKLRWRRPGGGWNDTQGVSLTAASDGTDLRLLDRGTSHVVWEDDETLFYWQGSNVVRSRDTAPNGTVLGPIGANVMTSNVHVRKADGNVFVYDTPYQEIVSLLLYDEVSQTTTPLASFPGHRPARGPYRCDLHPVPVTGRSACIVTSLADGGRQVYRVSWKE